MVIEDKTPWQNKTYLKLWEKGQEGKLGKGTLANRKWKPLLSVSASHTLDNKTAQPPVTNLLWTEKLGRENQYPHITQSSGSQSHMWEKIQSEWHCRCVISQYYSSRSRGDPLMEEGFTGRSSISLRATVGFMPSREHHIHPWKPVLKTRECEPETSSKNIC